MEQAGHPDRLRAVLPKLLSRFEATLRAFMGSPPQTNEVGRSAVLLGGFLQIAAATRLPLRLREIGASAGLNLIWDRYRHRIGAAGWGGMSPALLAPTWHGPLPPLATPLQVAHRAGCDVRPIDLADEALRGRLRAYVWPDHLERLQRLEAAIGGARQAGVTVERADAGRWVSERLATPSPGSATVLYHSIMWQYMPAATRDRIRDSVERPGAAVDATATLAWLRFEPEQAEASPELRLSLWPGARDVRLAVARPHGDEVTWLGCGGE